MLDSFDTGRLIYLVLLLLMVAGWFFAQGRASLNRTLQQGAIWLFIFLGAIAAYGLWGDIARTVSPQQSVFGAEGRIVVPRQADGHYYLTATVNGATVPFVIDTGATSIVLTREDAEAAGLAPDNLDFMGRANTANGEVRTAAVRLDRVAIGAITDRDVPAVVNAGEMEQSLLGMTYLQRWGSIEISGGQLTLTR